jgi:LPXTG-site transpeptidase (sortase) family protein
MGMTFDPRRLPKSRIALAAAGLAIAAALIAGVVVASSRDDDEPETVIAPTETASPSPSPSPQPSLVPVPTATPVVPGTGPADRIVIPDARVNAPITLKQVPPGGGALPSPNGPDDVVFYDFQAFPGLGGYPGSGARIVMSGHVDYGGGRCKNGTVPPPCTAVFWDLTDLQNGDFIELHLTDGVHRYRVTDSDNIGPNEQAKWDEVWKATPQETIALITCGGDFNRQTREYDSRHVVYGERIP